MWTPVQVVHGESTYGFGWNIRTIDGHHVHRPQGRIPGYVHEILSIIDDKLTLILLANRYSPVNE